MMTTHNTLLATATLITAILPIENVFADIDDTFYEWQTDRLFMPTDVDADMEKNGHVFIYSGIKDIDIELALDKNFDRIESMMFVNTIVTDKEGKAKKDPETGELITEDDDC